jgi:hypothetical protein
MRPTSVFASAFLAVACFAQVVQAQPAGYEYFGHYPDYATALRIAQALSAGNDARYDAGWAESSPNPTTRSYGVYARPKASNTPPRISQAGNLTKGHPMDRVRQGCHAMVYTIPLAAGQRSQFDLISPRGPNYFDAWLRIEDEQGNALANDDDSGEGLNARIVFNPPRAGTYRVVVTSYSRGATGAYVLTVR